MDHLKVEDLKKLLRKRGASTRGRKVDLIERLEAYKRNDNFILDTVVDLPVKLPGWPEEGYRQLSADHRDLLPSFHRDLISHYFMYRQVTDKTSSKDLKSLEKGQDLLCGKRIDACSYIIEGEHLFLSGIVRAAMKKNVSYNCKVKFNIRAELINSHCECPGGKGPHGSCKHIAALCLMVLQFKETGVLCTNNSCTDELQVFHHPIKKYTGSPVKGEDLKIPSKHHTNLDDPRPLKYRRLEGWGDFVRSQTINYCVSNKKTLSCTFMWSPANIQTAMLDHDYLSLPFVEYWIDKSNKVDDHSRNKIESKTRNQSECMKWYDERSWRLTASIFGTVTKIGKRRNIEKLCSSILFPAKFTTPAIAHGMQYEQIAVEKFKKMSGHNVQKCGLFVSSEFPFLAASPDGVIDDNIILEIKCPYSGRDNKITAGKLFPYLVMDSNNNMMLKKSHHYFDQVQGQLFISERKWCFFVVYTFTDFKMIRIGLDEQYCRESLIPKLECFYTKYYRPFVAKNISFNV